MFLVRMIKWTVSLFLFIIVAAVVYLNFADLNWLRPHLEAIVANETGRELKLNGNFELDLVPAFSISLEHVTFANADWGSQPLMLKVGHFSTELSLWSLISGPVRVHSLRLADVDLLLEQNSQQRSNWTFANNENTDQETGEDTENESSRDGIAVIFEDAELNNIKVTSKEPKVSPAVTSLVSLDIKTDAAGYMIIDGNGNVNGKPVKMFARLGPEKALVTGHGIEFNLQPVYGDYNLKANGILDVKTENYFLHKGVIQYKDTETHLHGKITRSQHDNSRLNMDIAGPSLTSLDTTLPAIPFKAALVAHFSSGQILLDAIDMTFGQSDLSGTLQVKMAGKTTINGELTSKRLVLTPFLKDEETESVETEEGQENSTYVFADEPLLLKTLNSVNLDLKTRVIQLNYQNIELKDVVTDVELKEGSLHYSNSFSDNGKGRSQSDIRFKTFGKTARLYADIKMRDMRINLSSGAGAGSGDIPPLDMIIDLKSTGRSAHMLAASANGRMLVTRGKGKVETGMVGKVFGDIIVQLFDALNPFATQDKYTQLECAIVGLKMTNGKAKFTGLLFQTEKIKAFGTGHIDLNTEILDIEFETMPRSGIGITADMFVTPFVKLTNKLANPEISLNKKGTLIEGGAALATGGVSLLAKRALDRVAGEKDSCAETLAATGGHPPMLH